MLITTETETTKKGEMMDLHCHDKTNVQHFVQVFFTAAASIHDILLDITLVLEDRIAVRISHCCYRMTLVLEDHIASCQNITLLLQDDIGARRSYHNI